MPMGLTAEVVAERYKVCAREAGRAARWPRSSAPPRRRSRGKFKDEIVPMTVTMEVTDKATGEKSQKQVTVDRDECNRPDTTLEGLRSCPAPSRKAAASPPATRRSSPTARRPT